MFETPYAFDNKYHQPFFVFINTHFITLKLNNITIHEGHGIREILAPPSDILK